MIFAKFGDTIIGTEEKYVKGTFIYEKTVPLDVEITTLYFYLSNDGDIALYIDNDKKFPSEDYFSVVGAMIKIDLPKPIKAESGHYVRIWARNRSGGNLRIIYGIVGAYK